MEEKILISEMEIEEFDTLIDAILSENKGYGRARSSSIYEALQEVLGTDSEDTPLEVEGRLLIINSY